jgi:hypothetical protein
VTTDNSGNASFTATLATTVPAHSIVTATATEEGSDTSPISSPVTV